MDRIQDDDPYYFTGELIYMILRKGSAECIINVRSWVGEGSQEKGQWRTVTGKSFRRKGWSYKGTRALTVGESMRKGRDNTVYF